MKVAFITRSTLYEVPGGDTIQVVQTANHLRKLNVDIDICLNKNKIDYSLYDLFHFFNITRPADILFHIDKIKTPFVLSPILVDYSEYDKHCRGGVSGMIFKIFSDDTNEYIKAVSRAIKRTDSLPGKQYILKGQYRSIKKVLNKASSFLPNSASEYQALKDKYGIEKKYFIVPNGIDTSLFQPSEKKEKDKKLIICAARIEGIKNQLNLIKAINNTSYTLLLIGSSAPNQINYYRECRKTAASNVQFIERLSQEKLVEYYETAKVHVLPSWFETCGLSSLEAAAMGCNIVITDKGYVRDYFGDDAFYCDPGNPDSIFNAIETASGTTVNEKLRQRILENYTWQRAAAITLEAYKKIIAG
jgi:glycosyltransferase involved in cell wall biosynthesis